MWCNDDPVKLLVLVSHFAPRFEGGSEIVARAQARELAALGHDVRILAGCDTPHGGQDLETEVVDGLPVTFIPRLVGERYDLLLERPRVLELVQSAAADADIVHIHGWATLAGNMARALSDNHRVVLSLHDLFVTCPRFFRLPHPSVDACPERGDVEPCVRCVQPDALGLGPEVLRAGLVQRQQRFQGELDAASALVLPSLAQRERLASAVDLDPGRTHIVPHGLCRAMNRAGASAHWDGVGPLRVLHLGNLTAAKGVLELARAAASLSEVGCEIEVVFAGSAVEEGIEDHLRELGGGANLRFFGSFDGLNLAPRLARLGGCHLAVLPSRAYESYGLVVDEALALGLPTWVSDRGAPLERIGAAGRVLPAEDSATLSENLLVAHRELDSLGKERAAVPVSVPDAARAAAQLEAIFLGLLA
ncbi:MAG: glycosyltransferase involved in cell wall biosynthesis [Planctomycetota bacterium]